ncbi:MAG: AAA family ATPase [Candidatus Atribacteria bacterium]|nr:AAA family ATPase [Candidatus Atribacteria bacterium]
MGPVLDVLNSGQVLFVDEIESSLHSLLVTFLVRLFHSPKINPKNAQIIFTTHNTRLLDRHLFRRDQIWFTEKNPYGASDLYSLAEIVPRKDRNYEKDYLNGRYGAVPNMRDFEIFYCNDDPKNQGAIHGE